MNSTTSIFILTGVFFLSFFSCSDDIEISNDDFFLFGIDGYDNARELLGAYAGLGDSSNDGLIKFSTRTTIGIDDDIRTQGSIRTFFVPIEGSNTGADVGVFKIGDIEAHYQDDGLYEPINAGSNSFEIGERLADLSGTQVNLSIVSDDGSEVLSQDVYFPEDINASFDNEGRAESTSIFLVNREDFTLRWQRDSQNQNGLLLALIYRNQSLDDQLPNGTNDADGTPFERVLLLDESGAITLDEELFQGIPQNGVATLMLMRGEVSSISDSQARTFQVQALHQQSFSLGFLD